MRRKSLSQRWRVIGLGAVLCLLAALFSFEAKIAWYSTSPAHTEISAAKLQPTSAPRLLAQALAAGIADSQAHLGQTNSLIAWLAAFSLLAVVVAGQSRRDSDMTKASAPSGFSPFRFSRPPPKS